MPTITQIMKHDISSQAATNFRFCRLAATVLDFCPKINSDNFILLCRLEAAAF